MAKTKVIRLSDDAHMRLIRLANQSKLTHAEIISKALDVYEFILEDSK